MTKRILLSLGMLVFVGAAVAGGTGAFFSDTETSTGNVFTAGSVSIGFGGINHVYGYDNGTDPVQDYFTTSTQNTIPRFAFNDLKPLDAGELSFDLENGANDAHVCGLVQADPSQLSNPTNLALFDNFQIHDEDGDRVTYNEWFDLGDINANQTDTYTVNYCFGEATGPNNHGCELDFSEDYNLAQGGTFQADLVLYAVQTRNNDDFSCADLALDENGEPVYDPTPTQFKLDEDNSPGTVDNNENETADNAPDGQPYFTYEFVDGGVEVTFENPSAHLFVFDYQVDNEAGSDRNIDGDNNSATDMQIAEGPLSGQYFGDTYNRVTLNGGDSQTVVITGDSDIRVGLREGAEQKWYINWVNFIAVN